MKSLFAIPLCWILANAFAPRGQAVLPRKTTVLVSRFQSNVEAYNDIHIEATTPDEEEYMPSSLLPPVHNRPAIASQRLSRKDVQRAIVDVKRFVEHRLETDLNVIKVSCPIL